MSNHSCIYEGVIVHRRLAPIEHAFRYRLFMVYLDLAELPDLFANRWLWSADGPAVAEFRRSDYLGPESQPLDDAVRDLVESRSGIRPGGPVRLLTHLRYCGYGFNPVSFFYCFSPDGAALQAVVADVSSTPWGERHPYVIAGEDVGRGRVSVDKQLHVSPFMPMQLRHRFYLPIPGRRLRVGIDDWQGDEPVFRARLVMRRTEMGGRALASVLCRFPLMTLQVIAGIYTQALALYCKGAPYFPHPGAARRLATAKGATTEERGLK